VKELTEEIWLLEKRRRRQQRIEKEYIREARVG